MIREVVTIGIATWLLITALTLGMSGSLFGWIYNTQLAKCHANNAVLLEEHRHGPLRDC